MELAKRTHSENYLYTGGSKINMAGLIHVSCSEVKRWDQELELTFHSYSSQSDIQSFIGKAFSYCHNLDVHYQLPLKRPRKLLFKITPKQL